MRRCASGFFFQSFKNQPASRLNVLGNAAALFCEQHIAVSIGKPNLVIAREAVFNVIESEAVFGLVLPRCNGNVGALFLLLKVLGQFNGLVADGIPLAAVTGRL